MARRPKGLERQLDCLWQATETVGTGGVGPKGDKGDKGDVGEAGAAGPMGPAGASGQAGITGATGLKGDTGERGLTGPKGDSGDFGPQGEIGQTGLIGPKGDTGDRGETGLAGADSTVPGPKGDKGDIGNAGAASTVPGPKGDTGNTGNTGSAGSSAYQVAVSNGFAGTEAQWLLSLKGEKGDTGNTGLTGQTGNTGPAGADGVRTGTTVFGYAASAGGTIAQNANKSTAVTLNKLTGEITMNAAALAAGAIATFVLTNSTVAAGDQIMTSHHSGGTIGPYLINARVTGAGAASVAVRNTSAASLSEAIVIKFSVIKSATA